MLKYYAAVVFVSDIELSKKFYVDVLNCEIQHDFGKNITFVGGLSIWELSDKNVIPVHYNESLKKGSRFELYFETEDIQESFAKIKEADVPFLHEIHEEPWGQNTIRFFDPDSHLIEIGESLKTFVKRFSNSGLTEIQVADKTGIPLDTILQLLK